MPESQHLPRRIADLALTIPEDTQRLAVLVEVEEAALARVAEAEKALMSARAEAVRAERERKELARDIEAVRALLEYGQRTYGYDLAPLVSQPMPGLPFALPVTPTQGVPVVRVAEPGGIRKGGQHCLYCEREIVQQDGMWLHTRTSRPECTPPADESAAHSEQDGSADL